jgi:hypothetical protein
VTGDLVAFLRERIDEDALWANEAGRCRGNLPPDGAHWQWEDSETDQPVTVDPGGDDVLFGIGLRSAEQYPYAAISGAGPQLAVSPDEIDAAVAGHIGRHDPARVLAEVDAKRRRLARHTPDRRILTLVDDEGHHTLMSFYVCTWCTPGTSIGPKQPIFESPCPDIRDDAAVYRDHPDYQPEWAPRMEG